MWGTLPIFLYCCLQPALVPNKCQVKVDSRVFCLGKKRREAAWGPVDTEVPWGARKRLFTDLGAT